MSRIGVPAIVRRRPSVLGAACLLSLILASQAFALFSKPDPPEKAIENFALLFLTKDARALYGLLQSDVITGKEISLEEIQSFLNSYKHVTLNLQSSTITKRMKAEDGSAERVEARIVFRGPAVSGKYAGPVLLTMDLLWVLEEEKWLLERALSIDQYVGSRMVFPTQEQLDAGARFSTAAASLDALAQEYDPSSELGEPVEGTVTAEEYRELEQCFSRELTPKGIDLKSPGVTLFLKIAAKDKGNLLKLYHGDFKSGPSDKRKPIPWRMFSEYANVARSKAMRMEKEGKRTNAALIHRRIINLGRQFAAESGGFRCTLQGMVFMKQGAEDLARITEGSDHQKALRLSNTASRRIDLMNTALSTLNEMNDYGALKAALAAADRVGDPLFMPWGINTLAIYAEKGAPADAELCKKMGGIVIVRAPDMQQSAKDALKRIAAHPAGGAKQFVEMQADWVKTHNVYGARISN